MLDILGFFFTSVLTGFLSVFSRIKLGGSSVLGVTVGAIILGMIIRSFVPSSR